MEVKKKIIEAAHGLFHSYGIRSVSMDDIARELSISKKTIYQSFKDKDEIVTLGVKDHLEKEKSDFDNVLANSKNAVDELVQLSTCLKQNMEEINPSMMFDLQKFHPNGWGLWQEFKIGFIKTTVLNVIKRGKEEGLFRQSVKEDIMANFRIESIEMAFNAKIFPSDQFNFVDVQLTLLDHFLRGMLSLEGIKYYEELINSNNDENK
ncbi:MAG: TetR/AcrR family transcriptional regulator [Reichenbachiella sp.]